MSSTGDRSGLIERVQSLGSQVAAKAAILETSTTPHLEIQASALCVNIGVL